MAGSMIVAELLFNDLDKIAAELRPKASEIVAKAAADIEARAKQVVPVDTGNLKNSIQTEMDGDLSASVGTNVEYAPYVEYGTSRMAAKPYLTPAAEAVRSGFTEAMKGLIG